MVVFCLAEVCPFCSGSSVVILVFLQKSISHTTLQSLGFYVLRLFPFTLDTRGVTANIVFVVTYKNFSVSQSTQIWRGIVLFPLQWRHISPREDEQRESIAEQTIDCPHCIVRVLFWGKFCIDPNNKCQFDCISFPVALNEVLCVFGSTELSLKVSHESGFFSFLFPENSCKYRMTSDSWD